MPPIFHVRDTVVAQAATELGLPMDEDMAWLASGKEKSQVPDTWCIPLPQSGCLAPTCVLVEVQDSLPCRQNFLSHIQFAKKELSQALKSRTMSLPTNQLWRLIVWKY